MPQEQSNSYNIVCKYCNEIGFRWQQDGIRWVLYDYLGERHSCQDKKEGSFFKGDLRSSTKSQN